MGPITEGIRWRTARRLDILFVIVAAFLVIRFLRTGGPAMLRMMNGPASSGMHDHSAHTMSDHGDMRDHEGR